MALPADQVATLHLTGVQAQATPSDMMTRGDLERMCLKIRVELQAASPGIMVDATGPNAATALTLKMNFTNYERGSAFARMMLIGFGQIHIDADIVLIDASGTVKAKYQVSKQFALGGALGGMTRMSDVEEGFVKSVVEIVKPKKK